jgi:hypothetical protein
MAHAPSSTIFLCGPRALALALALVTTNAAAGPERSAGPEGSAEEPWIDVIPRRCVEFVPQTGDRPDSEDAWRRYLSLAACVQDGSIEPATDPDQLAAMVEDMSQRLALPILIYLDALENAGTPIQLRAAFQVGMAYVALSTRARSAIAAPPDLATNEAAARRYRELHGRLEPLLVPARRAAWITFRAIEEAAAMDPSLGRDEVERHMICTARRMVPALSDAAPSDLKLVRRAAEPRACAGAPITASAPG